MKDQDDRSEKWGLLDAGGGPCRPCSRREVTLAGGFRRRQHDYCRPHTQHEATPPRHQQRVQRHNPARPSLVYSFLLT